MVGADLTDQINFAVQQVEKWTGRREEAQDTLMKWAGVVMALKALSEGRSIIPSTPPSADQEHSKE